MARAWPVHRLIARVKFGLFVLKLAIHWRAEWGEYWNGQAISEGNQNIGFRQYPPAPNEDKLIYPEWISLNLSLLKRSTALDKDSLYCCRAS